MAQQDGSDRFEIPQSMHSLAESSFEQARKAFESFIGAAQKTASTFEQQGAHAQANAKEISGKAVVFAEKNIAASLDHAEKLLKAKDLPDVLRLHSEFVQSQMRALAEQATEMGQAVTRAAMESTKPK